MDYTRLLQKLVPDPGAEDVLRMRVGTVDAVTAEGRVDLNLSGVIIENVPVLQGVYLAGGETVQVLSFRGQLLVLGVATAALARTVALAGAITNGTLTNPGVVFTNTLTTTGTHGVAFVAPPSGTVLVSGRAVGRNDTAGGFVLLDFQVREGDTVGSGTIVRAAASATAGVFESSTAGQEATLVTGDLVTGLTPGDEYNAVLAYAAGASSQNLAYNRRFITVIPQ